MFHREHAFFIAWIIIMMESKPFRIGCTAFCMLFIGLWGGSLLAQESNTHSQSAKSSVDQKRELKQVVQQAYSETHDGFSSDELILDVKKNARFIAACQKRMSGATAADFNWTLINLRKAGKLQGKVTQRAKKLKGDSELRAIAEIAGRKVQDQHKVSSDRIMTDPKLRQEFDQAVQAVHQGADLYAARRMAFALRKTRRLKPELITRLADWDRKVEVHDLAKLKSSLEKIPRSPGVYLFRDRSGYLYIGEAIDLRTRLTQHLKQSDRKSLADYLDEERKFEITVEIHSFAPDSRMKEIAVRRAYESELIRSRSPRFNVRN